MHTGFKIFPRTPIVLFFLFCLHLFGLNFFNIKKTLLNTIFPKQPLSFLFFETAWVVYYS